VIFLPVDMHCIVPPVYATSGNQVMALHRGPVQG